mmetsp:Transcript_2158/g.5653  ORF Transcript_2158/g.5653 Transcript_2158/m.5653 type:complete len:252 (-) Transcript_2158:248-1003(-)
MFSGRGVGEKHGSVTFDFFTHIYVLRKASVFSCISEESERIDCERNEGHDASFRPAIKKVKIFAVRDAFCMLAQMYRSLIGVCRSLYDRAMFQARVQRAPLKVSRDAEVVNERGGEDESMPNLVGAEPEVEPPRVKALGEPRGVEDDAEAVKPQHGREICEQAAPCRVAGLLSRQEVPEGHHAKATRCREGGHPGQTPERRRPQSAVHSDGEGDGRESAHSDKVGPAKGWLAEKTVVDDGRERPRDEYGYA